MTGCGKIPPSTTKGLPATIINLKQDEYMKIIKQTTVIIFIALFLMSAQTLTSKAAGNCDYILNTKCTTCHNLGRICRKLGKKKKSKWTTTIKRMVRHGAPLSKDEVQELAACLTEQNASVKDACK